MQSLTEGQTLVYASEEDAALKSPHRYKKHRSYNELDRNDSDSDSNDTTTTANSTFTATVTTTTKTKSLKQKKQVFKRSSNRGRSNSRKKFDEMETTEMTEMTKTSHQQIQIREISEITATEMRDMTHTDITKIREFAEDRIDDKNPTKYGNIIIKHAPIVITTGDEIKCCNTFDIYTGLYIIFSYNVFIGLLLILIIVWEFELTEYPSYFIAVWSVLFLLIRICISIVGFLIIPRMVGLHGKDLIYLKDRNLKVLHVWSGVLLYGPIVFNVLLIIGFIVYSVFLGILLDNNMENEGFEHVPFYQNVDEFTARFLLFCMGFITIITIIDTICEIMFYDTVKKFLEAKLQIDLCRIPCQKEVT